LLRWGEGKRKRERKREREAEREGEREREREEDVRKRKRQRTYTERGKIIQQEHTQRKSQNRGEEKIDTERATQKSSVQTEIFHVGTSLWMLANFQILAQRERMRYEKIQKVHKTQRSGAIERIVPQITVQQTQKTYFVNTQRTLTE